MSPKSLIKITGNRKAKKAANAFGIGDFVYKQWPDDMTHSLATDTGTTPHKLLLLLVFFFFPGTYFELAIFCYIALSLDEGNFWPLKQNGHLIAFLMLLLIVIKGLWTL